MRCSAFFCFFCVSVFLFVSFSVSFVSVLMKGGGAGDHGWVGGGRGGVEEVLLGSSLVSARMCEAGADPGFSEVRGVSNCLI